MVNIKPVKHNLFDYSLFGLTWKVLFHQIGNMTKNAYFEVINHIVPATLLVHSDTIRCTQQECMIGEQVKKFPYCSKWYTLKILKALPIFLYLHALPCMLLSTTNAHLHQKYIYLKISLKNPQLNDHNTHCSSASMAACYTDTLRVKNFSMKINNK